MKGFKVGRKKKIPNCDLKPRVGSALRENYFFVVVVTFLHCRVWLSECAWWKVGPADVYNLHTATINTKVDFIRVIRVCKSEFYFLYSFIFT